MHFFFNLKKQKSDMKKKKSKYIEKEKNKQKNVEHNRRKMEGGKQERLEKLCWNKKASHIT